MTARAQFDEESPVGEFSRNRDKHYGRSAECQKHFAAVTSAEEVFRTQQSLLEGNLLSADVIWDDLLGKEGRASQKKCVTKMQQSIDQMGETLDAQDKSLGDIEQALEALTRAIELYKGTIAESRLAHDHIQGAIGARAKIVVRMMKSMNGREWRIQEALPGPRALAAFE